MAILTELRDPRIGMTTVTRVEVSADLRQAKVHVSVMGNEGQQHLSLNGLRNAAGFLQSKVAQGIDLRYTPRLEFVLDQGVKKSIEVARILREVMPASEGSTESSPVDASTVEGESAVEDSAVEDSATDDDLDDLDDEDDSDEDDSAEGESDEREETA